jgi:hypothetical protein
MLRITWNIKSQKANKLSDLFRAVVLGEFVNRVTQSYKPFR